MPHSTDIRFEDFHFPERGDAIAFWQAQKALWRHNRRLRKYFRHLIYNVQFQEAAAPHVTVPSNAIYDFALKLVNVYSRCSSHPKAQYDVIVNPSFSTCYRKSEQVVILDLLKSCDDLKLKTALVVNGNTMRLFHDLLSESGCHSDFLNVDAGLRGMTSHLLAYLARQAAHRDHAIVTAVLSRIGITMRNVPRFEKEIHSDLFCRTIVNRCAVNLIALRCEWDQYSASLQDCARLAAKPVACFQHGVISHSLDFPVTVDRFYTFGESSCSVLKSLNAQFHIESGCSSRKKVEFKPIGSLTDPIEPQTDNYHHNTLLIIDQSVERSIRFNGLHRQMADLDDLIHCVLKNKLASRVIIRPHPENTFLESWVKYLDEFPGRFEISYPKTPLATDIKRSSVVVGLFSGALPICAASGLPTYFLTCEKGYYTPDLKIFDESFLLCENQLLPELSKILKNKDMYLARRSRCLDCSAKYYKDNKMMKLDHKFVKEEFWAETRSLDFS